MDRLELAVYLGEDVACHVLPRSGRLTIGRAPGNDIRLDDVSVSRRHAVLDLGPPTRIEDLGSANGTRVRKSNEPLEVPDTYELKRPPGETFLIDLGDRMIFGAVTAVIRRAPPETFAGEPMAIGAPRMRALHEQARQVAQGTSSVLLLGEIGVGKDMLAREIHRLSARATGPFVTVPCAGLTEALLDAELSGSEGAGPSRAGLFEAGVGGTVLLDEIGELTPAAQVKLLRVLEERAVMRGGAQAPRTLDVRFLAATSGDLEAEIRRGAFEEDLFCWFSETTLTLPPLRERTEEIVPLARQFLVDACQQMEQSPSPNLSFSALVALERYTWPGNVRELRAAMERAAVLSCDEGVLAEHLPTWISDTVTSEPAAKAAPSSERAPLSVDSLEQLDAARDALERRRIVDALERCGGNQTRAAAELGINRRTLVARLGEYGLLRQRKRE